MDPNDLRARVEQEIVDRIEPTAWDRCVRVNEAEQELLRSILAGWGGMIDFDAINRTALPALPALLDRWAPGGRHEGREYVARNPKRHDRRPGSFRINLASGRWADFATGDAGGDVVSLAAFLFDLSQAEAARRIAGMLGIPERTR